MCITIVAIARVLVWADLVKSARKGGVWDVAHLAAKMCILYDDNRWHYSPDSEYNYRVGG